MTSTRRPVLIAPEGLERPEDDHLEAVRDWLASRVARVEAVRRPGRLELDSVADDILDEAESFGAGLIVAGPTAALRSASGCSTASRANSSSAAAPPACSATEP